MTGLKEVLHELMQKELGRMFIFQLLEFTGAERVSYPRDTIDFAFYQGKATVGVELLQEIRNMEDGIELEMQMRLEARARPTLEDIRLRENEKFYNEFIGGSQDET